MGAFPCGLGGSRAPFIIHIVIVIIIIIVAIESGRSTMCKRLFAIIISDCSTEVSDN
jgi:hypothetical protein